MEAWGANTFMFGANPAQGQGAPSAPFLSGPVSGNVQSAGSGQRNAVSTPQSFQAQQQAQADALRQTSQPQGAGAMPNTSGDSLRQGGQESLQPKMHTSRVFNPQTRQVETRTQDLHDYDNWSDLRKWFYDNGYGYVGGPIVSGNGRIYSSAGWFQRGPDGMPVVGG